MGCLGQRYAILFLRVLGYGMTSWKRYEGVGVSKNPKLALRILWTARKDILGSIYLFVKIDRNGNHVLTS